MMKVRLNTQTAFIPFLSSMIGSNVLQGSQLDKNYVIRYAYIGRTMQDKDIGIPMPIYAENVLPSTLGIESVAYTQRINGINSTRFDQLINLKSGTEFNIFYSPAQGLNYINYSGKWIEGPPAETFAGLVTSAYLKLRSFIFYQRNRMLEYDFANKAFKTLAPAGLEINNIDGITSANNALVAWNETTIFWSSFIDPLNFIPSLSSGAGSTNPTQVRGKIVVCVPAPNGFIIYTTANALYATWSNNIRYPWTITEIPGSQGIVSPEHVTYESNYDGHIAWTPSGLFKIQKNGAEQIFTEVTDFLTGHLVEEYIGPTAWQSHQNEAQITFHSESQSWNSALAGPNLLQQYKLTRDPWVKVVLISSRYLLISYGYKEQGIYDWVIVHDFTLARFGKLKIRHVDAFAYVPQPGEATQVKDSIGFLAQDGAISVVDFAHPSNGEGILLYGKIGVSLDAWLTLYGVSIQTIRDALPALTVYPSYDGTNLEPPQIPELVLDTKNKKAWQTRITGLNLALLLSGSFSLSAVDVEFDISGSR